MRLLLCQDLWQSDLRVRLPGPGPGGRPLREVELLGRGARRRAPCLRRRARGRVHAHGGGRGHERPPPRAHGGALALSCGAEGRADGLPHGGRARAALPGPGRARGAAAAELRLHGGRGRGAAAAEGRGGHGDHRRAERRHLRLPPLVPVALHPGEGRALQVRLQRRHAPLEHLGGQLLALRRTEPMPLGMPLQPSERKPY
mmetsp:Transcript_38296/g.110620  ORF Transcript_38296/g.110620 Transcript_38296/m.110620 type:complete len:201 (+) Transcript_38296:147-749(+)